MITRNACLCVFYSSATYNKFTKKAYISAAQTIAHTFILRLKRRRYTAISSWECHKKRTRDQVRLQKRTPGLKPWSYSSAEFAKFETLFSWTLKSKRSVAYDPFTHGKRMTSDVLVLKSISICGSHHSLALRTLST